MLVDVFIDLHTSICTQFCAPDKKKFKERKRMQARLTPRKRRDRGFSSRSLLNLSFLPRSLVQPVSARLFRWKLSKQASTHERAKLPRTLVESHESRVDREFAAIIEPIAVKRC